MVIPVAQQTSLRQGLFQVLPLIDAWKKSDDEMMRMRLYMK